MLCVYFQSHMPMYVCIAVPGDNINQTFLHRKIWFFPLQSNVCKSYFQSIPSSMSWEIFTSWFSGWKIMCCFFLLLKWLFFLILALHTKSEPCKPSGTFSNRLLNDKTASKLCLRPFPESAWKNMPPLASSDLNFFLNFGLKNMLMKTEA